MTSPQRKSLVQALSNEGWAQLSQQFDAADTASERLPLPPGKYRCQLASGALIEARTGTPGYELAFVVTDGPHAGRRIWHKLWLTARALPMTKRDLAKLGITSLDMLGEPLPPALGCEVRVALHTDNAGIKRNCVIAIEVVEILSDPTADPDFPSPLPDGDEHGGGF